jgi:hypothetical protein
VSHPKWINDVEWKLAVAQLVHPSTPSINFIERKCLHGSLWLIQPRWSTWGTRVNVPLAIVFQQCSKQDSLVVTCFLTISIYIKNTLIAIWNEINIKYEAIYTLTYKLCYQ